MAGGFLRSVIFKYRLNTARGMMKSAAALGLLLGLAFLAHRFISTEASLSKPPQSQKAKKGPKVTEQVMQSGYTLLNNFIHSPHEIISTVCDFPYKIIERKVLSVKCFKHHLYGKIIQQNELWTSVMIYELHFHHK